MRLLIMLVSFFLLPDGRRRAGQLLSGCRFRHRRIAGQLPVNLMTFHRVEFGSCFVFGSAVAEFFREQRAASASGGSPPGKKAG